ncbi:hypothetical protein V6N13_033916 [Hibiscus sabdariffa]
MEVGETTVVQAKLEGREWMSYTWIDFRSKTGGLATTPRTPSLIPRPVKALTTKTRHQMTFEGRDILIGASFNGT